MQQSTSNSQPRVKILILGQGGVGKTSLLSQFVDEEFKPNLMPTIGVEYKQKIVEGLGPTPVRVQVWDTAGTERFRTITPIYYKNCDGVLLVFDISDKRSFETVHFWIKELNDNTDVAHVQILLVGNKCDLQSRREVKNSEASDLAKGIDIDYFETSAKDKDKTRQAFNHLIVKILQNKGVTVSKQHTSTFKLGDTGRKKEKKGSKDCCN